MKESALQFSLNISNPLAVAVFKLGGKSLSISAFTPFFTNGKLEIKNLSPLLGGVLACAVTRVNILPQLGEGGRRPDGETSSRREKLNNFPLQRGRCHEVTGGDSSRRVKLPLGEGSLTNLQICAIISKDEY